jgi:hypothetical protein
MQKTPAARGAHRGFCRVKGGMGSWYGDKAGTALLRWACGVDLLVRRQGRDGLATVAAAAERDYWPPAGVGGGGVGASDGGGPWGRRGAPLPPGPPWFGPP